MKTYKLQIEINVAENWIADGFNPETKEWREDIEEAIVSLLPYADEHEFIVKVTKVTPPTFTIQEREDMGLLPPAF